MGGLGTVLIMGAVLGVGFAVYMEVDKYKTVKILHPGASKKQLFSKYVDLTNADADRRRKERREEAARRNERYLKQVRFQMDLEGKKVFAEDDEKIYFIDSDGHTCSFDKDGHFVMEEYI